ncbi:MAG: hypothetical protein HQM03_12675 [Magnetococcales bacterium]|nr:hypothetical protein [Magnetococcales bacterium]
MFTPNSFPLRRSQESAEQKFARLANRWKEESAHLSSVERMAMLRSYQAIIGMGAVAVPLLLRELQKEPDHWFWALQAITEADPANGETLPIDELAARWVTWGQQEGWL